MNNKLLVICGPTATGKTSLAINLAKKFNGEIVSADSRQVYKGMDIGTGKDLPKGARIHYPLFSKWGFYTIDGIKIWGHDLTDPKREFNVSWYLRFAKKVIFDIQKKEKLPILVGGTGLYIKGVTDGIPTAEVPKNQKLRVELEKRSAEELYENLSQMDSLKAASLNSSDKKNPRRLIRAIEIAQWRLGHGEVAKQDSRFEIPDSILFVGLTAPANILELNIAKRVKERVEKGIKKEIEKLLKTGVRWDAQSMMSLGYRQWRDYFEGGVEEEIVINEWEKEERKYAKRQMTWFKKEKRINWFDIAKKNYFENVEKLAEKWHNNE